ncbi:porin [Paraburkholderia megapolitana]|uniref:Outer membrane protein (Porin) n=1 Tax=Paraburkholderia megapolitana TaxID=420953 RepID=A0A1I3KXB0_9BURK|nr:porin [Paraburkholderia megapolitana]QDQ80487.1 porin [Paraburkholderia megapolitana]SFI77066.1 Outer membrane protein (porin) [Paraburkholderia megapolitana]
MNPDRSVPFGHRLPPCSVTVASICLWAGVVQAQSSSADSSAPIQLYGLVGTYIAQSKLGSTPQGSVALGGGGLTTSFWGLRGKEDRGGGYATVFVLESFFRPNTGQMGRNTTDGLFSRNAYVGFATPYGIFRFGEQTTHTYLNQILLNPFGSSVVFAPLVVQSYTASYNNTVAGDTVWANVASYETAPYKGITGTVQYGASGMAGDQGHDNVALNLNYDNGPLQIALSAQRVRVALNMPNVQQYLYLAGVTYNANFTKVYAAVQTTNTTTTQVGSHTYELGLSIPATLTSAVLVEWAMTRRSAPKDQDSIRNTASLGYDYFLSKRTDAYAVYSFDKLSAKPSGNSYGVGMRHTF